MKKFTTDMLNKKIEFFANNKKRIGVIVGYEIDEFENEETGTLMFGGINYTVEENNGKQYKIHESDIM